MTTSRANTLISAITSTLFELDDGKVPASSIYLALGMNLTEYRTITHVMGKLGLVVTTSETITLTSKGADLGAKCSKILAEAGI